FGNVYTRNPTGAFDIARKPHHKLKAMLQKVDDTYHIAKALKKVGWPSRWNEWSTKPESRSWQIETAGKTPSFSLSPTESTKWLRYKHIVPSTRDWLEHIENGQLPPRLENFEGQLIGDFYTYNFFVPKRLREPLSVEDWMSPTCNEDGRYLSAKAGIHWVNDLAIECEVKVKSDTGQLELDLVKSGTHFTCSIDIATGKATLASSNENISFVSNEKKAVDSPTGKTPIKGKGAYRIRYANCDDKLYLWVNEKIIRFEGPTEYVYIQEEHPTPKFSAKDPGDAQPAGVGGKNIELTIDRFQVLRDVFYINTRSSENYREFEYKDYPTEVYTTNYETSTHQSNIRSLPLRRIFEDPTRWNTDEALDFFSSQIHSNPNYFYELDTDQFMPLGDNSPSSQDARAWDHGHYFERKYLIGKALLIYWPHAWRQPFLFPNFRRIGFIR
ncbi:MAG: hypothetical protein VX438_13075, partial [Planctomycetota bacterium]|nr:hypothetical protein [Planctomycetota bacterium]